MNQIVEVEAEGVIMDHVLALWRKESATVGFLAKGAFVEASNAKTLLANYDPSKNVLLGYILYRITRVGMRIAHLCVSSDSRKSGVAKALLEAASMKHPGVLNIGLKCRQDYGLATFWSRLGFAARHYVPGRGKDRATLVHWVRDNGHEDLFSALRGSKVEAVMDSCVYFDIVDGDQELKGEESRRLEEEWIEDSIHLLVSQEIHNDMHRDPILDRRERRRGQIGKFLEVRAPNEDFQKAHSNLIKSLPPSKDEQTESDYRHIAWAIAAKAPHFLTRDEGLLELRDLVSPFGVSVLSPGEFARRVDELERSEVYRPEDIQGCGLRLTCVEEEWLEKIGVLAITYEGETPTALETAVRRIMAKARHNRIRIVSDAQAKPLALYAEEGVDESEVKIGLVRFSGARNDLTLARYIVQKLIADAAERGSVNLTISDPLLPGCFLEAILYHGFEEKSPGLFSRFCRKGILIEAEILSLRENVPTERIHRETWVWPMKASDISEPCYIIPIKPTFAADLFDHELAQGQLLRVIPDVLLQDECAYYTTVRHIIEAPGRILWYVSHADGYQGTSAIRACSFLQSVKRGTAKAMFKEFKRYGVFQWGDIKSKVNDVEKDLVSVLRFSHTEAFKVPIPLTTVKEITKEPPAWPTKIDYSHFLRLYRQGQRLDT